MHRGHTGLAVPLDRMRSFTKSRGVAPPLRRTRTSLRLGFCCARCYARVVNRFLPCLLLAVAPVFAADTTPVFFRASFDGTTTATLRGTPLTPVRATNAAFDASDHSQALVVGSGTLLEYDLGDGFPA